MQLKTRHNLFLSWAYCDKEDKSTGHMLQFMQDYASVDLDCVLNFIENNSGEKRDNWYKNNPDWYNYNHNWDEAFK